MNTTNGYGKPLVSNAVNGLSLKDNVNGATRPIVIMAFTSAPPIVGPR